MTSQAELIRDTFKMQQYNVFCFANGYAITAGYRPETIRFPIGRNIKQRRNSKGRVTFALFEYMDGSQLSYRYSDITFLARVSIVRKANIKELNK